MGSGTTPAFDSTPAFAGGTFRRPGSSAACTRLCPLPVSGLPLEGEVVTLGGDGCLELGAGLTRPVPGAASTTWRHHTTGLRVQVQGAGVAQVHERTLRPERNVNSPSRIATMRGLRRKRLQAAAKGCASPR